ncbi:MAG: helix-turn-helix domain-containing protein [Acetatifactor sp.]
MDQLKTGRFIAELRKRKGYTQSQLANILQISDRTVSKWERGIGMPDTSLMLPLCQELQISVNELLMGEKIPEEEFKTRAEENVMDVLTQYKKKMRRLIVTMMVIFYFTAIFVSLCLSNRLVTGPYMNMGSELFVMLDEEMRTAKSSGDLKLLIGNIPVYGKCFDYPVCLILIDEQGNVIAETATDKDSDLYRTCLKSALDGREGRTGFLEASTSAEQIVYLSSIECDGKKYTLSAYSHINQVIETFRSDYFLFSLLIMTGVLVVFLAVFLSLSLHFRDTL